MAQVAVGMTVIGCSRVLRTAEHWMMRQIPATLLFLLAAAIQAAAQPVAREDRLTTPAGLTLYTFDNDVPGSGKSACNPPCSSIFPPYLVEPGASASEELSIIERSDGAKQWAYKGKPLYVWFDDKKPGDAGGDGMNRGIWRIARL
jgi:predicted lipoprotein with Yx(FWY)xxD motif